MKKIRTLSMLQDRLDQEFSWRLKELADLKIAIRVTGVLQQKTIIRAAVPLLYAHWEGFVKNATLAYVNFVNCQRLRCEQLASCFIAFGVKKRLAELPASHQVRRSIAAVEFFMNGLAERADLRLSDAVDTESNLSSRVFGNIAVSVGIQTGWYEARYNLIDVSLLKRRNRIAHGDYLDLDANNSRELIDEMIFIMRAYKTDIENTAGAGGYLRS